MPLQQIIPTWFAINGCNDISPSGLNDNRTKAPVFAGGLNQGDYFDLTEQEAAEHSYTQTGLLHAGRYRRVKIDENATPAQITRGRLAFMPTLLAPNLNVVTSYDHGIHQGRIVVMLNVIDPGNYGFVQELGVASVYTSGTIAIAGRVGVGTNGAGQAGGESAGGTIGYALQAHSGAGIGLVILELPTLQG
jgi:hypothetical protein